MPLAGPVRGQLGTWLRQRGSGLMALALLIGVGSGLGAIAFRWLITSATELLTGRPEYTTDPGAAHAWLPGLGVWFLVLAPAVAGLLYGPLVYWLAPEAKGHGVPEVMYAVSERGGRIQPQVSLVKALASALCIGGGGSVGREGPIVQIGSALGSTVGHRFKLTERRMRVLVACGAAGGIAATFNAPMAGPFFAMELILRDFAVESFGAVVLSSVTASVIGRAVMGNEAFLTLPDFHLQNPGEFLLFALLGVLIGVVGLLFSKVLYGVEDLCDRLWRGPEWLRPGVGGLLLGLLLLVLPQMYGVGYPVLGNAIHGNYAIWFLIILLFGKMLATSLTIGIGGSGGVFAPALFVGGMGGTAFGTIAHGLLPGIAGSPGAYGLIGMGAAFAGSARAPITAVIILFELTGQYSIILPLMLAVVVATLLSRTLSRDTIYTAKLARRGIDLDARQRRGRLPDRTVADVMETLPDKLTTSTKLSEAAQRLAQSVDSVLPVVDENGRYQGCVTAGAVAEVLGDGTVDNGEVGKLLEVPPEISPENKLVDALDSLVSVEVSAAPVLDERGTEPVGWISHRTLLSCMGTTANTR
ncbi:CIC family chloride channel protein [Actinopolyspora biskrensis]|uniref:CIC family chloride channel protein n=1 Tax=Actinopolyspora biskrensis TaxID=1470178 RepID=A0A852Z1C3_9ACTN|nr:chloride channel protein [Actinopolyspora biskrensis]NYH79792.1 CIC family chloride channel protein [Actinopolyspora biskrensis]